MSNTAYTAFVETASGLTRFRLHAETRKGAKSVLESHADYPAADEVVHLGLYSHGPTAKDVEANAVYEVSQFAPVLNADDVISVTSESATLETAA